MPTYFRRISDTKICEHTSSIFKRFNKTEAYRKKGKTMWDYSLEFNYQSFIIHIRWLLKMVLGNKKYVYYTSLLIHLHLYHLHSRWNYFYPRRNCNIVLYQFKTRDWQSVQIAYASIITRKNICRMIKGKKTNLMYNYCCISDVNVGKV